MTLTLIAPDVAYIVNRQTFAAQPACPRCPWRSDRGVIPGSPGWRAWIALDVHRHACTNPDQEKPA